MFQLHVSIYVSIISIDTKRIILFHNYKFVSRVSFISVLLKFYQCFRRNNYWLGSLGVVYIYYIKFPLGRTITRKITDVTMEISTIFSRKSITNELRMVGDFRMLTIFDEVDISDLKTTIEQLSRAQIYHLLDFLKAFNLKHNQNT